MKRTKIHLARELSMVGKAGHSRCGLLRFNFELSANIGAVTCKNCVKALGFRFEHDPWKNDENRIEFKAIYGNVVIGSATLVQAVNGFCAFITDLGVLPQYRNRGIATKLIREILAFQAPPLQVNVRAYDGPDNEPHMSDEQLHKFYAKFGFVEFTPSNRNMILLPVETELTKPREKPMLRVTVKNYGSYCKASLDGKMKIHGVLGKSCSVPVAIEKSEAAALGQLIFDHPYIFGVQVDILPGGGMRLPTKSGEAT